ncbi:ribonuclease J [Thermotoga sp. KOL6]|uniref:ribonuclease J n=1 Tax=Thermotoga sp. KOL6 TaxID=126741 RepID=UPI000C75DAD8|nr:ribonuclease J [Thermotoga sp. KOL6]PLV59364.1 MBL fold metallo-hydrolase [Thermotoga sp. KOL6]
MRIEIFDGHRNIGGNKIRVVDSENDAFLLDFGLNFSRWSMFFEEFLNPRTGRIVQDLLKLNLIPRLNIYREDLFDETFEDHVNYSFLFLSHAHADHTGMIGLVNEKIPLLMTSETLAVMNASVNTSNTNVLTQLVGKKRVKATDKDVERGVREDLRVSPRTKDAEPLTRIVSFPKEPETLPNEYKKVDLTSLWKDELLVEPVYHSVIGAAGLVTRVDNFWIAYTGDFRTGPETTEEEKYWLETLGERRLSLSLRTTRFFENLKDKKPLVLIVEGTRVTREEDTENTEKDVFDNAMEVFKKTKDLIFVDFPTRHLERLFTFLRVCMENERKLVLMPKDYAYLIEMERIEPLWKLTDEERSHIRVYHPGKISYINLEKEALIRARDEKILIHPEEINFSPRDYAIVAGYWDFPHILDLDERILNGAVYIHSTSEAYTEEQEIDARRFLNWIEYFNIKPRGIEKRNEKVVFTKEFHASGHVSPKSLKTLIEAVNPDYIVPVHTLNPNWFSTNWPEKVLLDSIIMI